VAVVVLAVLAALAAVAAGAVEVAAKEISSDASISEHRVAELRALGNPQHLERRG